MRARDELEAVLRDRPDDRSALAVFADLLQAAGDPRGELIAVELERERADSPALAARCRELRAAWLGVDLDTVVHDGIAVRFGSVDHLVLGGDDSRTEVATLATILAHASTEVRRVTVTCHPNALAGAIDLLCARALPSLVRLDIAVRGYNNGRGHLLTRPMTRGLIAATPRLVELGIEGARICEQLTHPNVRILRIDGDSITDLYAPAVTELDLRVREELAPIELSSVVRLGLDRSEPEDGGRRDRHGIAARWPLLRQLVLPSIRTFADRDRAQAALDRLPDLETLELRRDHAVFGRLAAQLRHPRAAIALPDVWPWPPRAAIRFAFQLERLDRDDLLALDDLIPALEAQYGRMPTRARAAWDDLWRRLSWDDVEVLEVPTALLVDALESLDLDGLPEFHAHRDGLRARRSELPPMTRIQPEF